MKISSIVFTDLILKSFLGAIPFLIYGVNINNHAIASTLNFQNNYLYELEGISDFSLKFDSGISNQLEQETIKNQLIFSDYVDLIDNGLNQNQYQAEAVIKILVQSQEDKEQKLLESLLVSLKQLELTRFSEDNSSPVTISTLPQVNYRNLYKDVYDFDIALTSPSTSQPQNPNRNTPESILTVRQPRNLKSFTSYFQEKKKSNYPSFENKSINTNKTYYSLATSPKSSSQLRPSLANLVSSSLSDSSFSTTSNNFSSSQNSLNALNNLNNLDDVQPTNDYNTQLKNEVQAVYLPSTQVEIYQVTNFNVSSLLSSYQKPQHQEELDRILEKQEKKQQKQREKMSKQLEKLRQKREKDRQKKLQQYRKQREKSLAKALKQQRQQQAKQQQQLR